MCGIVGYTGKNNAVPYLIGGLDKLEYRGYDSTGIAVAAKSGIETYKRAGRLSELKKALPETLFSFAGIGHTRWATHGAPLTVNAHPHVSAGGMFAVVHNGIIENCAAIRAELEKCGMHHVSQTDTETVAHLLEKEYDGDVLSTLISVCGRLEGSYALAVICKEHPDKIYCAKKDNPLALAVGENETFVASDITAVLDYTRDIYKMNDGEFAVASPDGIMLFDKDKNELAFNAQTVPWSAQTAQKDGFSHFMLKEIHEQPDAVKATVNSYLHGNEVNFDEVDLTENELKTVDRICIVACGSAYHVGVAAKYIFEKTLKIPTVAEIASEFRYSEPLLSNNSLVVIISQSGETADTLAALRLAKKKGARTVSVVNVVSSTIAQESDGVIYTKAGPEIAVATTKAYSAQLAVTYLFAAYFGKIKGTLSAEEYSQLVYAVKALPEKIKAAIEMSQAECENLSRLFVNEQSLFFIGRNLDYAGAMEASLKLKEISYIHSEALAAGELKHGTISLIEKGTLVVALCCHNASFAKTLSNIKEVKARGAVVICVTDNLAMLPDDCADYVVKTPRVHPLLTVSTEIVPMQFLSFYTALGRGCDIDKPKNLAKSVTVE